jgi:glycosyltransferase involved in cell wall biosynthesis
MKIFLDSICANESVDKNVPSYTMVGGIPAKPIRKRKSILLSICIPSYNRGHRALELVKKLLNMQTGRESIEILCSNNGSTQNVEGYDELRKIKDSRFRYHEFSENRQFLGNINQLIKMSDGQFCMIISDEDMINEEQFGSFLFLLREHPELGLVKAETSDQMDKEKEKEYISAGREAIDAFYMTDYYVSGITYNRKIITNELIDNYAKRYEGSTAYLFYPHIFYDTVVLLEKDIYHSNAPMILKGEEEQDIPGIQVGKNAVIPTYGTYENRLEQMHGFVDFIADLNTSVDLKFQMFAITCQKTALLISAQKNKYQNGDSDWNEIMKQVSKRMKAEFERLNFPLYSEEKEEFYGFIDDVVRSEPI